VENFSSCRAIFYQNLEALRPEATTAWNKLTNASRGALSSLRGGYSSPAASMWLSRLNHMAELRSSMFRQEYRSIDDQSDNGIL